ncbi:hypothetical protein 2 [Beihai picorna-like virus 93]|uniref:hypothetical protein 2 n=1 Tax=Beihai picorna-like virus 93 TaxID=1922639 RepID=UPI00090B4EDC|nr:hypothetical protein 2 [Beihai picorna-like virus 93]APG76721.1 hypothetical protein 2 [Beihai picorna-like virus 93]
MVPVTLPALLPEGSVARFNDIPKSDQNVHLSENVTHNLYEVQDQALVESLERSVLVSRGIWTSNTPQIGLTIPEISIGKKFDQPFMDQVVLPDDIVQGSDFMSAKLANIAFMSADYEITVRVQSNPFQQGALWLWNKMNSEQTSTVRASITEHLRSITSAPGVELNLQNDSRSVTLSIPYTSEFQVFNPREANKLNSVRLSILSPLRGPDDVEKASYSIFARLVNVKLYGHAPLSPPPSSSRVRTQLGDESGVYTHRVFPAKEFLDSEANAWWVYVVVTSTPTDQIADVVFVLEDNEYPFAEIDRCKARNIKQLVHKSYEPRIRTQAGTEEQSSSRGIVTDVADTIGSVAGAVGEAVPILQTITKPVSWLADAVSGVASLFGFSKDRDLEKVHPYENIPGKGYTHGIGFDSGLCLSMLPNNMIDPAAAVVTQNDEMAIATLARRPFCIGRYDISAGDAPDLPGQVIAEFPISPVNFATYGKIYSGYRTLFAPPVSYAAALFAWWRGEMNLNLRFAKTQFHQGRLLVQYFPYGNAVNGVAPVEEVLSQIIDISTVGEEGIDVSFPSVIRNKWLQTFDPALSGYTQGCAAGKIVISVLSQFIAAQTVNQSVQMYPWVSWPHLEVAEPGALCKAAVGYSYPSDPKGDPAFFSHTLQDGDKFTLTTDTRVCCGVVNDGETVAVVSDSGGRSFPLVGIKSDDFLISVVGKVIPQGEYTFLSFPTKTDVKLYSDYPIDPGSEPNGSFNIITVSDGDIVEFQPGTEVVVANVGEDVLVVEPLSVAFAGNVILEYSGGASIDLRAASVTGKQTATVKGLDTVSLLINKPLVERITTQMGTDFGGSDSSSLTTTMGEVVDSLRLLCRRGSPVDIVSGVDVTLPGISFTTDTSLRQSIIDVISYLYRFTHGGVSYKLVTLNEAPTIITTENGVNLDNAEGSYVFDNNAASHFVDTRLNSMIQVTLPFYCPSENLVVDSSTFSVSNLVITNLLGESNDYFVLKAGADDHTFSQLVGAPAFIYGPRLTSFSPPNSSFFSS